MTRGQRITGALFIAAGVNHFVIPRAYQKIVPPGFGDPTRLVAISGVAEVAGGVGVLLPRTRRLSGLGLIALLLAVFPANLYMARSPARFHRIPRWALYARLPLQPLMIWSVWRATRSASAAKEPVPTSRSSRD
ncbi:MAG TPA: DoxX family membrane protein [Solirubrobacteraceae bacterium]